GTPGARQLTHPGACSRNATCPQARSPSTVHSCELPLGNALAVSVELATFTRNLHHTLNCEEPVCTSSFRYRTSIRQPHDSGGSRPRGDTTRIYDAAPAR